ncbi:MAG: serine hydrolase domain-containing protein [Pseudomonadota bacterium]
MLRLFLALSLLLVALPAAAQVSLRDSLEQIREASTIPSMGYVVIENGEVLEIDVIGDADRNAVFRAGSISKTATTIMLLSLVNEGALLLDTPLRAALPDIQLVNDWSATSPIRLVDLLEQTSGLPGTSYADYGNWPTTLPPTRMAELGRFETRWPPGQFFSYANINHTLAAAMAEARTGISFDTLMAERVFAPLGMRDASFDRITAGARFVRSVDTGGRPGEYWDLDVRPSGALVGTIDDIAALARFLATDGATAPAPLRDIVPRMRTPEAALVARQGFEHIYGAGLFPFVENEQVYYGHWGRIDGFQAVIGTNPLTGGGFALVANGQDRRTFARARARLAAEVEGVPVAAPKAGSSDSLQADGWWVPFTDDSVQRAWISEFLGLVLARVEGDTLLLRPGLAPWTLTEADAIAPSYYAIDGFPVATHVFATDEAGETFLLGDSQLTLRRIGGAEAALRLGGLVLFIVALGLGLVGGSVHAVRRLRGRRDGPGGMWALLWIAAASAVLLMALHVRWGMLAPLSDVTALSEPGLRSISLLTLSLLWPIASVLGLLAAARHMAGGVTLSGATGVIASLSFLLAIAYLATFGFIPLVTW